MLDRVEIKEQAKAQLAGKVWPIFGCCLLGYLVVVASQVGTFIPLIGFLVPTVVQGAIIVGVSQMYLNVTYGDEPKIEDIFSGFKRLLSSALLTFLIGLFISLWSILFVIPGIIMAISYSMSWYIMCENPDMSVMDCIRESKSIMHGHKMEYFVLMLSFIGWMLLGCVTFGIAYIYVVPYMKLASVNFYHRIKNVYTSDEGYTETYSQPVDNYSGDSVNESEPVGTETVSTETVDAGAVDLEAEMISSPEFPDIPTNPAFDDPFSDVK